ncbi:hypothetical protein OGAPHI_002906 [Ogataea philodendri]|uniref:HTH La-type RNA-binding domain-containing protein n=1 Tax=Ogataea philodendri TaxID=1378263 RepID=A0A9P8P9H9_9ASCO|nr:uncharacterized protein OGAPHI_002906 [Ogataea philodendri]KAH3667257.1 hypothetical protein OGAPHI_002906 [Ogataea philodendri]
MTRRPSRLTLLETSGQKLDVRAHQRTGLVSLLLLVTETTKQSSAGLERSFKVTGSRFSKDVDLDQVGLKSTLQWRDRLHEQWVGVLHVQVHETHHSHTCENTLDSTLELFQIVILDGSDGQLGLSLPLQSVRRLQVLESGEIVLFNNQPSRIEVNTQSEQSTRNVQDSHVKKDGWVFEVKFTRNLHHTQHEHKVGHGRIHNEGKMSRWTKNKIFKGGLGNLAEVFELVDHTESVVDLHSSLDLLTRFKTSIGGCVSAKARAIRSRVFFLTSRRGQDKVSSFVHTGKSKPNLDFVSSRQLDSWRNAISCPSIRSGLIRIILFKPLLFVTMVEFFDSSATSAAPKVSTLLPAPPPEVNPWKKSTSPQHTGSLNQDISTTRTPITARSEEPPTTQSIPKAKKTGKEKWVPLEAEILVSSPTKSKNKNQNGNSKRKENKQTQVKRTGKKKTTKSPNQLDEKQGPGDAALVGNNLDTNGATDKIPEGSDDKNLTKLVAQLSIDTPQGPDTAPPSSYSLSTLDNGISADTSSKADFEAQGSDPRFIQHQRNKSFNGGGFRYNRKSRNAYPRPNSNIPSLPPYPMIPSAPYYIPYYMPPGTPYGMAVSPSSSRRNSQFNSQSTSRGSPSATNDLGPASVSNDRASQKDSSSSTPMGSPVPMYGDPGAYFGMYSGMPPPAASSGSTSPVPYYAPYYISPPGMGSPVVRPPPQYIIPADDKVGRLTRQLEYYFSVENLLKDIYLRRHMDSDGYVSVAFIGGFSRVKILSDGNAELIFEALERSELLQVEGSGESSKVRLRNGWEQWVFSEDQREQ